jgi:aconitate hydratase
VAIALCGAVYKNGFVKNRVLEFAGPGVAGLPMDFRIGIDVMTTETACLSSVWVTDERVEEYLTVHGRPEAYKKLEPAEGAYYDGMVEIDLSAVEPMIALPFHPSEAYSIHELQQNAGDILRECEKTAEDKFGGKVKLDLTSKLRNGRLVRGSGRHRRLLRRHVRQHRRGRRHTGRPGHRQRLLLSVRISALRAGKS